MVDALFSLNTKIIGKDKSLETFVTKEGQSITREKWVGYKNRFVNYSGSSTLGMDDEGNAVMLPMSRKLAVHLIAERGYATAYILKDDTLKKGRSLGHNTLGARMLMVDFDNTWSIEDAMAHSWWPKVWFAYTTPSFGALQDLIKDADRVKLPANQLAVVEQLVGMPKRNFRLVFKLARFISDKEILDAQAGMMSIFPMADQSCIDDARIFFGAIKGRVEMPEVEAELSIEDIDLLCKAGGPWREEHDKIDRARTTRAMADSTVATGDFGSSTVFTLASGEQLTLEQIFLEKPFGWKEACYSIFRPENNPSCFVSRFADNGNVFVYDSGASLKKVFQCEGPATLTLKLKKVLNADLPSEPDPETEPRETITLIQLQTPPKRRAAYVPDYMTVLTVEERRAQIKETVRGLATHNVFFAPEGFGKSFITWALTSRLKKVLFCCATNEQAELKAAEFAVRKKLPGFPQLSKARVQLCVSRDYLFRKATGIAVVRKDQIDPFELGAADKVKTVESIVAETKVKVKVAHELWVNHYLDAPVEEPDFASYDIIVTTMARAQVLAKSFAYRAMSKDWVVLFDDPGHAEVSNLVPVTEARDTKIMIENERREKDEIAPLAIERKLINKRQYYVRPLDKRIGMSFEPYKIKHELGGEVEHTIPVIYTTTEELTKHFISRMSRDVKVFDFMHELDVRNVTLWGTSMTHAKNDGLIILAAALLQLDHPEESMALIGDGLGQKLNHINNKGQNDLATQHLIIELSQLHPTKRQQLFDEMTHLHGEARFSESEVQTLYMRDQMHQAIGRNSGYRDKDEAFQTIVLCDPHHYESLVETSRYLPAPWSCQLDINAGDSTRSKVRRHKRAREILNFHGDMPPMVQTLQDYVTDPKNMIEHEKVHEAVAEIATSNGPAKKRLFDAFNNMIKENKQQNETLERLALMLR